LSKLKKSCFLQVSEKTAKILHNHFRFKTSILGTETIIHKLTIKKDYNFNETSKQLKSLKIRLEKLEKDKDKLFEKMSDPKVRKRFWYVKKKVQNLESI